jgi:hypothetical protein
MRIDVSDLAVMLAQRVDQLARTLLPRGVQEGNEWRVGSAAGEPGRSMAVHLKGGKAGVWKDFSSGETGDALELVSVVRFGGNRKEAIDWATSWLGLDGLNPDRLKAKQREAKQAQLKAEADALLKEEKMRTWAVGLWQAARADIVNTPVHEYLMLRCLDVRQLPRIPGAIRFAPDCYCGETKTKLPAMVAMISDGEGKHIATHRTYLAQDSAGRWRKDKRLRDAKRSLGRFRGGFISLNRGASNKPLAKAPEGDRLILCEGIEDGLTLALACPDFRVLAGVSLGNFNNIILPPAIQDITIAADNDGENAQAAAALEKAIAHFQTGGRTVRVARSEVGKDFNDELQVRHGAPVLNSPCHAGAGQ